MYKTINSGTFGRSIKILFLVFVVVVLHQEYATDDLLRQAQPFIIGLNQQPYFHYDTQNNPQTVI